MSTFDCFLEIDGITADSEDSGHRDEIEVLSFRWGESQYAPVQSGLGAGVGQVRVQDLEVMARTGRASPRLMVACADGRHIAKARLTCCLSGVVDEEFLVINLSSVLVSSYHVAGVAGGAGALPTDEIVLNFRDIKIEYRARRSDGSLDSAVMGEWDVRGNRGT